MKNIELLAPAGSLKKLEMALLYGADAVYVGGSEFGLRALADNFSDQELKIAVQMAHAQNKKIYVTLNIFARNDDFDKLVKFAKYLESIKVDAAIVSDLGVLAMVREHTNLDIHISTQANVTNKHAAMQYAEFGAKRIILARECSINQIREITTHLNGKAEIEVFVHGAMCVSYSGRCLLSDYITQGKRESNRGSCFQPCRVGYSIKEEKRDDHYEMMEDKYGTYIMNSRDLCLIEHLDELKDAGVTSLKIEGRTKTEYYVAAVTNAYRRAMNGEKLDWVNELEKVYHRPYTTSFTLQQHTKSSAQISTHKFVAIVTNEGVEQRNLFSVGDELEILSPSENFNKTFKVTSINNGTVQVAKKVQEILTLDCPYPLNVGDILRKKN